MVDYNSNLMVNSKIFIVYFIREEALEASVRNALEKTLPGHEVEIDLTFEPAWNYDMVSAEGMQQLNER